MPKTIDGESITVLKVGLPNHTPKFSNHTPKFSLSKLRDALHTNVIEPSMSNSRPSFDVPPGAVAKVSIIDSTLRLSGLATKLLCKPDVEGFDEFPTLPTWSFLVESPSGKKALFDLGVHVDLSRYTPNTQKRIKENGWKVETKEPVADIIKRHGADTKEINSIIWR